MALKDLLVHVDGSRASPARLDAAAELARVHDAHLTGIYVVQVPVLPTYAEVHIPASIIEAQREAAARAASAARKQFESATGRLGISAEWRCIEGGLRDVLALNAHYADLLVVGQADPTDPACVSFGVADHLALECGRPVMVIPAAGTRAPIGRNVVVAWNARREAVRAVGDTMPLLEGAVRVTVVTINASQADPDNAGVPAADISLHLARHGIETRARNLFGAPAGVGEQILDAARDEQADLLVMGAYGHSRFRELVLGGVTAHVLTHTNIPVCLSH